jgi:hypothetical protein
MNIHDYTQRLREDTEDLNSQDNVELESLFDIIRGKVSSGEIDIHDVEDVVHDMFGGLKEMSATGGGASFTSGTGEQYAPGLDVPAEKYKKPYVKKETKDKEPKLAAGKIKKDYAVTHFGFKEAPSIPNRPDKGGFQYKSLWAEQLDESYSKFKKQTSTRSKKQQYHEGVKLVRKELGMLGTMMEYLNKLKENLNEDGSLEESRHTKRAVGQIMEKIKHIYRKAKQL